MTEQDAAELTGLTPNGVHSGWRMHKRGGVIMTRATYDRRGETEVRENRRLLATVAYDSVRVAPAVVVPARSQTRARFVPLARWEGVVLEVFGTYFSSEVVRLDGDDRAYVEFDVNDISESDRPLCEPGALFYWSVGYDVKSHGSRARASLLAFRRLPSHSA